MTNIKITSGDIVIPAVLNDTVAANDFVGRLPFKVTGNDSGIDYCCVAKEGKSNPIERQNGWKNGDINLAGGWFALLYGGEEESETYTDMMIIGHIQKEHLATLKKLPNTATFLVELA
ncbi:MAG: cyclophilin-like fold protein [Lachnospiraceae bacterium]|nr:cyclophilin-like fold protein [Lachnospiraceae bacterium]MDD3615195.1 cyclophilin-like fold protein [Lachnospiraceae bacterium]